MLYSTQGHHIIHICKPLAKCFRKYSVNKMGTDADGDANANADADSDDNPK